MDVRAVRESLGWSQRRLADWLKVSQSLVAQWERDERAPSEEQVRSLSGLERRSETVVRLDSYPSAPRGGRKGSKEAEERLAWMNARNRAIQRGVIKGPNPGPVTG